MPGTGVEAAAGLAPSLLLLLPSLLLWLLLLLLLGLMLSQSTVRSLEKKERMIRFDSIQPTKKERAWGK